MLSALKFRLRPGELRFIATHVIRPILASYRYGRRMRSIRDRTRSIEPNDILAVIVLRNEAPRVPYFLAYYRRLGIDHFLFVDNGSTDGIQDLLANEPDCSVWYTEDSYKAANFGEHWANYLLRKYGTGHWCMRVDADELLIYPHHDTRGLKELTAHLDETGKESFFTLLLDMYSKCPLDEAIYTAGEDPLTVCPWFDPYGYTQSQQPMGDWWIQGGARRRAFYRDGRTDAAPALNKFCLVKWRRHYNFISSTHYLVPRRLNHAHYHNGGLAPTGCLLHFKHFASFRLKVEEELERGEHFNDSIEYKLYAAGLDGARGLVLWNSASARFSGWRQCLELGLMTRGRWF